VTKKAGYVSKVPRDAQNRRILFILLASLAVMVLGVGCSNTDSEAPSQAEARHTTQRQQQQRRLARAHRRAEMRAAHRRTRRHARLVAAQRHRARERREAIEAARAEEAAAAEVEEAAASECDPNYEGACLDPNSSDYDCEGGSGNGPDYTGTVTVVGEDHYGLDADGDGVGCEPY
jgi:hypothetical protein